jgi:hypothetical protein
VSDEVVYLDKSEYTAHPLAEWLTTPLNAANEDPDAEIPQPEPGAEK